MSGFLSCGTPLSCVRQVKKYLKGEKVSNECNSSNYFFPHLPVTAAREMALTWWDRWVLAPSIIRLSGTASPG